MSSSNDEIKTIGDSEPRPDIWRCPHCGSRIQVIVDPDHAWDAPFTCVCRTPMQPEEVHETAFVTDATCAHCGVTIVDESTVVAVDDARFCCQNCAAAMSGRSHERVGRPGS